MPSDTRSLADEFVAYRRHTEHIRAMWDGDLRHLEEWEDVTNAGLDLRVATLRGFSERADRLGAEGADERALAETVAFTGDALADALTWREELAWLNNATGLIPLLLTFLPRHPLVTPDDGQRYLEKIARLPGFLDEWGRRVADGARRGITPITHVVVDLLATIDRQLDAGLAAGPLGAQPGPTQMAAPAAWTEPLHELLDTGVSEAMARLRDTIDAQTLPATMPDERPGLVHLHGGEELYGRLVRAHTTLDIGPAEVHRIGLEQVRRLEDEYREVAGPLLGESDIAAIYRRLRDDDSLHYTDGAAIVDDATRALARAASEMGRWFGTLPAAPCVSTSTDQGALAFYSRPAEDGSKPGTFFFNTSDPSMWGTFMLEAVTYHESIPGHHLQIAIAQESDLHPLLANFYIAAYNEGWGLYTERLADEMGLYTSEWDRLGMLAADSMRACRLVVDTGIHALGWSRDRAVAFMSDHSPLSRRQIEGEIDRYIGSPGQALGYMIGRLEIDRIRAGAETTLGGRFDIREFHDAVLATGSVPLATLARAVGEWAERRAAARS